MLLTRRSLLRAAALPLVLPSPSIARGFMGLGGGSLGGGGGGPVCGTPIDITSEAGITGPGCYSLIADIPGNFTVPPAAGINNVTVLGNNHKIGIFVAGYYPGFNSSGIVVQDLVVGNPDTGTGETSNVYGDKVIGLSTPPAVHLKNMTFYSNSAFTVSLHGNNIFLDNCVVFSSAANTDDTLLTSGSTFLPVVPTSSYLIMDGCYFGANYDLCVEGLGAWDHVTITNCNATPSGSVGSIGGWYGPNYPSDVSYSFIITNCTFTGNTVRGFEFAIPGGFSRLNATTDALANATWGTGGSAGTTGNVFGGAGPLANTYVP